MGDTGKGRKIEYKVVDSEKLEKTVSQLIKKLNRSSVVIHSKQLKKWFGNLNLQVGKNTLS